MVIKQGISSKELMEYMSFFGLNYVYTAEELESARYQKQINNKEDKTIEEKYNVLLNKIFKVNGSVFENDEILPEYFEQYKNNYLSSYQKKYGSKKPYIKQEEALNLELDSINELIRTYKEKITESNSTNFRDIVNEFYKLYSSSCKTFLTDYYDIAKEKNNNQGAVILDYVKNERINNVLNTTLLDLVDIKLPKQLLDNQKSLSKMISDLFYKLDKEYKKIETASVLEIFYKKIDEFLEKLFKDIQTEIKNSVYKNNDEIEQKYNEIVEMINPRIKLFNDELQDTIGQALKNKINNQAELSVPKKDLLDKIKYANNFENYVEVFNIVYNINNRKQDSNEEKDVQVISVKR